VPVSAASILFVERKTAWPGSFGLDDGTAAIRIAATPAGDSHGIALPFH
jgi:hypothetical protein